MTKREYGGREFLLKGSTIRFLEPFGHSATRSIELRPPGRKRAGIRGWEFARIPPSLESTTNWLKQKASETVDDEEERLNKLPTGPSQVSLSAAPRVAETDNFVQIEGPTQISGGFKIGGIKTESSVKEKQHLAILAIELQGLQRLHFRFSRADFWTQ